MKYHTIKPLFFLYFTLFTKLLLSQSIDPFVITSGGGQIKTSTMTMDYTISETVVMLMGQNKNLITNGIQQPNFEISTSIIELPIEAGSIKLFPNPFLFDLNVDFSLENIDDVLINIYNNKGEVVENFQTSSSIKNYTLGLSQLLPGIYYVDFYLKNQKLSQKTKIIKIQ